MNKRTTFIALALLVILHLPVIVPAADSPSFAAQAFGQSLTSSIAASRPAQALELSGYGQQRDSRIAIRELSGTLFENVVAVLQKRYYNERFREETLPKLVAQYADKAGRAKTLNEQREVVQEFLSRIPSSHLGLLSRQTYQSVMDDLQGRAYPTFGFQLTEIRGKFFAATLLEGGPAARAGLLSWDRIVSIDGIAVEQSQWQDWRSDDAYIPDDRDPPVHNLIAKAGDTIRLKVERQRDMFIEITVAAEDYSALSAAQASAQVYKIDGRSFGYLHFWYVHIRGVPELIKQKLEGEFKSCDGLLLDLRGRGGSGTEIPKILNVLRADRSAKNRPIVALIDRQSRSAKDVLAYEFKQAGIARLVGERSAGAVIPATFAEVGYETILMFPSFKLPRYTDLLESKPVEPDVFVERAGPLSAGDDPILKAGLAEALKLVKATAKSASTKAF